MLEMLHYFNIKTLIILTKSDKLSGNEKVKQIKLISDTIGVDKNSLITYSTIKNIGRIDVWNKIKELI